MPGQQILLKIEFLRIQTFLFAIPRLKPMLGANALLGRVMRYELPKLAGYRPAKHSKLFPHSADPLEKALYTLASHDNQIIINRRRDDPEGLRESGILTRDGGHFQAVFNNPQEAEAFRERATTIITERLPGLRFEIELYELQSGQPLRTRPTETTTNIAELPHFRVCEETGTEMASVLDRDDKARSRRAAALMEAGKAFQQGSRKGHQSHLPGYDIISLLQNQFPGYSQIPAPEDLQQLAGPGGYIAVIHADGNSIGERRRRWADTVPKTDRMAYEAHNETFFHAMRRAIRTSLVGALEDVFATELNDSNHLPYQVLMLGGDDLVLVCQARFALAFVRRYAEHLQNHPIPWQHGETRPISIGAGVAIARYNIPVHRLHRLAEQLASSAKQLYRLQRRDDQNVLPERSVVDWLVTTASWADSPAAHRQRHQLLRYPVGATTETLALTGKPYFILPAATPSSPTPETLAGLLDAAKTLLSLSVSPRADQQPLARSQLKNLAQALHQGRRSAQMAFRNLPEAIRHSLQAQDSGGLTAENLFFHDSGFPDHHYLSRFPDLLELMEIEQLGRKDRRAQEEAP